MRKVHNHIIKEIFKEHWEPFHESHKEQIRPVVVREVEKMLRCMDIEYGYTEYKCYKCGETKKVGFSCKSRLCTSCGKVSTNNWIEEVSQDIMPVAHRHAVSTIPEELRYVFLKDRSLLKCLPDLAAQVVKTGIKG